VTLKIDRDLEITLESALLLAAPDARIPDVAAQVYDAEPELMNRLQREWIVERLTWMLYRKRAKIRPANQLTLPGFERIPQRLKMPDGRFTVLKRATVAELRQYRRFLADREDPRIEQIDRLIELVQRYARRGRPAPTVLDAMQAEQAALEHR
jgi:hypothetical protein